MTERNSATRLHGQLLSLSLSDLSPPHVDPRVAAHVALGVVDFARGQDGQARFGEAASGAHGELDPELLADLGQLADALLKVVDVFDAAPRDPKPVAVAPELDVECRARRAVLVGLLAERSPRAPGVASALRRVKLSYGASDLASDLRSLAAIVEQSALDASLVGDTRALAKRLEDVLVAEDTPELREARLALRRVWTLFERTYRKVAELGRELFSDDPEALFPTLEAIAGIERTARHESSSARPASTLIDDAMPKSVRAAVSVRAPVSLRGTRSVQSPAAGVATRTADVELDLATESTLWLGFSQDIAEGGVFIATHAPHALGTPMDLTVRIGTGEPMTIAGIVHWTRTQLDNDDAPPGLGVRFTSLSVDAARALSELAARRTPIFYDD